jgi:sugar/nucleoside kinase (ribokinase family)
MSLVAVGTVAFDDIVTPTASAKKVVGGACTYIAMAASYFVKPVQIVSVIGDDFPDEVLRDLRNRGVDLEGLQIKKGEKSFFWAGSYHKDMNNRDTLATDLNVLATFKPVLPDSYKKPEVLMLGNLVPAIQMEVLTQLDARPELVVLDTMNFWMDNAPDDLRTVLKHIDVLTINDEEARQLSGEHTLVLAAKLIHQMGPKYLIIKKGEHGALLFHDQQMFYAPALPLAEVTDPTGAGDTFAGGFTGYLAHTRDYSFQNMKKAVIAGSAMASFCVEDFSIRRLQNLTIDQINNRMRAFADLVHF